MTKEKNMQYKKAYVELYEIINALSIEDKNKIPNAIIKNINENKDNNYKFKLDTSKTLLEQNLMVETKALLVQIYAKYIAPDSEKEKWKKYNKICINQIEEKKRKQYGDSVIFQKNEQPSNVEKKLEEDDKNRQWYMVKYKESFFKRFIKRIKRFFNKSEWNF